MQATAVKPPAAAGRAPPWMVSALSLPGSRRWTCISMKPGATTRFAASKTSAPARSIFASTAARRPSSTRVSRRGGGGGGGVRGGGGEERPALPLELPAQHHHDVGGRERLVELVTDGDARGELLESFG